MLGQMSTQVTNFKSWTPPSVAAAPEKVKKKKRQITREVHPIFLTFSNYYDYDEYWANKLRQCAQNKLPNGFRYQEPVLSFRKANKYAEHRIADDSVNSAKIVVEFFRINASMFSPFDQISQDSIVRIQQPDVPLVWSDAKPSTKDILIRKYCDYCQVTCALTSEQRRKLLAVIVIGLFLENITANDIRIVNNSIVSIDNISYEDGNFYCNKVQPIATPTVSSFKKKK